MTPDLATTTLRNPVALLLFTRHLGEMLAAGVLVTQALDSLQKQAEDEGFFVVVGAVSHAVRNGATLSQSMARFPRVFGSVYVSMVLVGEKTGQLSTSLLRLADWLERDHRTRTRVRSALVYPTFVLGLAGLLTLGLFWFVMPQFVAIFESMDVSLPWITRFLVWLTRTLSDPLAWGAAALGGAGLALAARSRLHDAQVREALNARLLRVPMVGPLLRDAALARMLSALATLLGSGLLLTDGYRLAAMASGSPLLRADAARAVEEVKAGASLSRHFRAHPELFPPAVAHMVYAGEESGQMEPMLERLARYFEAEVGSRIDTLSAALEPLLLSTVAAVVGGVVLAIFLPMQGYLATLTG